MEYEFFKWSYILIRYAILGLLSGWMFNHIHPLIAIVLFFVGFILLINQDLKGPPPADTEIEDIGGFILHN